MAIEFSNLEDVFFHFTSNCISSLSARPSASLPVRHFLPRTAAVSYLKNVVHRFIQTSLDIFEICCRIRDTLLPLLTRRWKMIHNYTKRKHMPHERKHVCTVYFFFSYYFLFYFLFSISRWRFARSLSLFFFESRCNEALETDKVEQIFCFKWVCNECVSAIVLHLS